MVTQVVVAVMFGALTVLSVQAALANLREFRRERGRAPLEPSEVYETQRRLSSIRAPWPQPEEVSDHRLAAAYRDYACVRHESALLIGEVTMFTASAALGGFITRVFESNWAMLGAAVAVGVGGGGFVVKHTLGGRWARIAARYERRRVELRRPTAPPEASPAVRRGRRRWWRWW